MDYTTSQLYDDVDIRLNKPIQADDETIQKEDIPHIDAEIVSPMDVYVHHEVPSQQTLALLTIHVSVIIDSLPLYFTVIPQSLPSFTPPPQQSTSISPPTIEAINPQSALPDFASVFQFNNRVSALEKDILPKEVSNFAPPEIQCMVTKSLEELKKILIDKIDKSESYMAAPEHRECYEGLIKSYDLDKTLFSAYEPTKYPKAKESQSGSSKGAQSQSKSSGKSVQSEEPEFEVADSDMPQDQEENPGNDDEEPMESHIGENNVEVMRKHGYGYLKEIVVRRADNNLYRFKEGDFPCLRINDIEDMLLLVVQNRLTDLSDDDVFDFAITLRMFTRSLVIQKRVEDLQLRLKVTRRRSMSPSLKLPDPT
ncbi:hypothetical protein Tco_0749698 [Tanacetum coccineum]|uniref:Uncharacterized protein n=1 Tax=Tanacetum coccineum TaxID=301880 RepID=A0ABQ4Z2A0_9ASTR